MNILEQIEVKQNPFGWLCEPQPITMSKREIDVLPALISELVGMSIKSVSPTVGIGRVLVFDVFPREKQDPPLVFCRCVNLVEYYYLWRVIAEKSYLYAYDNLDLVSKYAIMMSSLNISELIREEAAFLLIELLKFKNEYVRRA